MLYLLKKHSWKLKLTPWSNQSGSWKHGSIEYQHSGSWWRDDVGEILLASSEHRVTPTAYSCCWPRPSICDYSVPSSDVASSRKTILVTKLVFIDILHKNTIAGYRQTAVISNKLFIDTIINSQHCNRSRQLEIIECSLVTLWDTNDWLLILCLINI